MHSLRTLEIKHPSPEISLEALSCERVRGRTTRRTSIQRKLFWTECEIFLLDISREGCYTICQQSLNFSLFPGELTVAGQRRRNGIDQHRDPKENPWTSECIKREVIDMAIMWMFLLFIGIMLLSSAIRVLREYERGVVFRLGRLVGAKGPGLILLIPIIDRMTKVSLRTVTMDIPPQDVITKDNVSIKVNAVLYFRVIEAEKAVVEVEDYLYATSQLAQTTLRSVLGEVELDELLSEREKINVRLQGIIDQQTDPWGIKVSIVEVKHVDLPQDMQRAIARQAEAERERRAKIIHAEGELQAASKLLEASQCMAREPISLQLRFLQTLTEVASENNSTTIFPVPIDLLTPFMKQGEGRRKPSEEK